MPFNNLFYHRKWRLYGYFASNLLNLRIESKANRVDKLSLLKVEKEKGAHTIYSVVTLNYDLIFETIEKTIRTELDASDEIHFETELDTAKRTPHMTYLAKLHGSIDPLTIVPPTWQKGNYEEVIPAWKLAAQVLNDATQIRFLGYSLPETDIYVTYLLKAAVVGAKNLKQIDVICLDDRTGSVESRYKRFIEPDKMRFLSANIEDYLFLVEQDGETWSVNRNPFIFNILESVHEKFMTTRTLRRQ
ncbi:SIR2 family protein [Candidatus Acetothermia bacterium]|nr:SIR2 family protein [Candidatus Acetothermia bacterium]